jgi:hypothetical protein
MMFCLIKISYTTTLKKHIDVLSKSLSLEKIFAVGTMTQIKNNSIFTTIAIGSFLITLIFNY